MGWVDCNGNPREDNLIFVTSVIIGMPMSHQCKNAIREGQAEYNIIPTVTHLPWRAVPGNCTFRLLKKRNL
jgi:hypothetical protein